MIILEKLEEIPSLPLPIALTIGSFDGVHLGHQHLLSKLKELGTPVVLTFSNHPAEVLRASPPPLIDTLEQKLRRLKSHGVALTICLPFNNELAAMPYDIFLKTIHQHLPFSHLVLGEGAAFGHQAQGHSRNILPFSYHLNFTLHYLPKFTFEGEVVSSKKIRELIEDKNFEHAFRLLGRPTLKEHL